MHGPSRLKKMRESNNHRVVIICFTLLASTATTMSKPSRFVTKLIHRDSVDSPYYNPEATFGELGARARESSKARLAYLSSSSSRQLNSPNEHRAGIVAQEDGTLFMTLINVGDIPSPQLFNIDTGSDLTWLQCQPCLNCFKQLLPVFEPSKSKSYAALPCASPLCTLSPPPDRCDLYHSCKFHLEYLDGTTTDGVMATDKLSFKPLDFVTDVVLGCVSDNHANNGQASGLLGLGVGNISLVTHLGSKFSYCIGSITDHGKYSHNFLILGDGAKLEGDTTKLEVFNGFYYLTVTGISIDTKALDIDPSAFKRSAETGKGGVLIDSGSTVSYLVSVAYRPLSNEVMRLLDGVLVRLEDKVALCYKGVIERDLIGFPVVTIHFEGGAELALDIHSLFIRFGEGEFCLAVEEIFTDDINVIGVLAQQSYDVGYDIAAGQISFQRIDCDVYEKMMIENSN